MNFDNITNLQDLLTLIKTKQTNNEQKLKIELDQIRSYLENVITNMTIYEIQMDNINIDEYKSKIQKTINNLSDIKTKIDQLLN
jgi:hypothetical protein